MRELLALRLDSRASTTPTVVEMPQIRRSCPARVRFTATEFAFVRERAQAAGRPLARYVREAALGAPLRTAGAADPALIREMLHLGNALQRLADDAEVRGGGYAAGRSAACMDREALHATLAAVNAVVARL